MYERQRGNYQGAGENCIMASSNSEWGFQMDKVELDWQHTATKKNTHSWRKATLESLAQNQPTTQPA
jgi:hypothetical protein